MAKKTTVTYTCDRCGKVIELHPILEGTTFYLKCLREKIVFGKGSWNTKYEYDLCNECADEFRSEFMKGAI